MLKLFNPQTWHVRSAYPTEKKKPPLNVDISNSHNELQFVNIMQQNFN